MSNYNRGSWYTTKFANTKELILYGVILGDNYVDNAITDIFYQHGKVDMESVIHYLSRFQYQINAYMDAFPAEYKRLEELSKNNQEV